MHRLLSVITLAVTVSAAVVACTPAPTTSPEAAAAFCADVKVLQAALNDVSKLSATSSKDEVKAAAEKTEDAWQKARNSAQNVKTVDVNEVRYAYDNWLRNVNEIRTYAGPVTPEQQMVAFTAQTAKFKSEVDKVFTGAKCV